MDSACSIPCIFLVDTSRHMEENLPGAASLWEGAQGVLEAYCAFEKGEAYLPKRSTTLITYGNEVVTTRLVPGKAPILPPAGGEALLGAGLEAALALLEGERAGGYRGTCPVFLLSSGRGDDLGVPQLERLRVLCETFPPKGQLPGPPAVLLYLVAPPMEGGLAGHLARTARMLPVGAGTPYPTIHFSMLFEALEEYSPQMWRGLERMGEGIGR